MLLSLTSSQTGSSRARKASSRKIQQSTRKLTKDMILASSPNCQLGLGQLHCKKVGSVAIALILASSNPSVGTLQLAPMDPETHLDTNLKEPSNQLLCIDRTDSCGMHPHT